MTAPTLALADVHRVTVRRPGAELDVFVFDHHRTAFTLWCHAAARAGRPLTLVTLDRHMDLMTPAVAAPGHGAPLEELDAFARHKLSPANDDHVVAALEAGALADAVVIARSHPPPSLAAFQPWRGRRGDAHRFLFAESLGRVGPEHEALVDAAGDVVLDVDLDCFTTRSDADPEEVLAWDAAQIEAFLLHPRAEAFLRAVLARARLVTIAREPYHCGGFARGARLWLDFAEIFFRRVLGVPSP